VPVQDVIGQDVDDSPRLPAVPSWQGVPPAARLAVVGLAAVLAVGLVVAGGRGPEPVPTATELAVVLAGERTGGAGRAATGEVRLRVVNASDTPAEVGALTLSAPGLQVLAVEPADVARVAAAGERSYRVRYRVADCTALRLPAQVEVAVPGAASRSRPLGRVPADGDAVGFSPCSVRALPAPALAVRPLGGTTEAAGAGARGRVRLEVRNGGPVVRLLSMTAEVPGVRFAPLVSPHGLVLGEDERLELVLGFEIEDCARLLRAGRLVLRAARHGVESELALTITHDREAGTLRQLALDRVLGACPR